MQGGLNYGIDFRGGTMVHVRFPQPTTAADIRNALANPDLKEVVVQDVGQGATEFQIRVHGAETGGTAQISDAIKSGAQCEVR
jgi:preprotein translocase subunit SecF